MMQALVTKYDSISNRRLPLAVEILGHDKSTLVARDYGPHYSARKRHLVTHLLGPMAQVRLLSTMQGVITTSVAHGWRIAKIDRINGWYGHVWWHSGSSAVLALLTCTCSHFRVADYLASFMLQKEKRSLRHELVVRMINGMFEDMPTEGKVVHMRHVLNNFLFENTMHQVLYTFASTVYRLLGLLIDITELRHGLVS